MRQNNRKKHVQTSSKTSRTSTTRLKNTENNKEQHLLSVTFLSIIIRENLKFPGLTDWSDCCLTTMKEERKTQHSGKPFAFTSWQDVNFQSQNFPRQSDHQCAETG